VIAATSHSKAYDQALAAKRRQLVLGLLALAVCVWLAGHTALYSNLKSLRLAGHTALQ
jgi:hypothetical protein